MGIEGNQCPDRTVDALLLHIGHICQANKQVVTVHIGYIITKRGQCQNQTGTLGRLCSVELLLIIDVFPYKLYNFLIVSIHIGGISTGSFQTNDDPLTADRIDS